MARTGTPDFSVTLKRKDSAALTYRLKKIDNEDEYHLASSEQDYLFRVPKYAVQSLLDASREKLVKPKAADADDGSAQIEETPPGG